MSKQCCAKFVTQKCKPVCCPVPVPPTPPTPPTPDCSSSSSSCSSKSSEKCRRGKRGHKGKRGKRGRTGCDGVDGAKGATGAPGPAGPIGATGPVKEPCYLYFCGATSRQEICNDEAASFVGKTDSQKNISKKTGDDTKWVVTFPDKRQHVLQYTFYVSGKPTPITENLSTPPTNTQLDKAYGVPIVFELRKNDCCSTCHRFRSDDYVILDNVNINNENKLFTPLSVNGAGLIKLCDGDELSLVNMSGTKVTLKNPESGVTSNNLTLSLVCID